MSSDESSNTGSEPSGDVDWKAGSADSTAESSTLGAGDGCSNPEDWGGGRVLWRRCIRERSMAPLP